MNHKTTHDYTKRYLGHDYVITEIIDNGQQIRLVGWGHNLKENHYILLENEGSTTRYKLTFVKYYSDPSDMWSAVATFAPRQHE